MKWLFTLLALLLLSGCRTMQYVPVETVRSDTLRITQTRIDSVTVRDSIYMERRGDTVYRTEWRWRDRLRLVRDTLYSVRSDSIAVPYPVEKKLSRWGRIKQETGGIAIAAIILGLLAYFAVRFRKK